MKFKVCNDVVEAVAAAEERRGAAAIPMELIAGFGVRPGGTAREKASPEVWSSTDGGEFVRYPQRTVWR
jgi:hypothetical protein